MDEAADLPVRPTKRSLDDLGQGFLSLDVELHDVSHALVKKAQQIPEEVAANGAERIRSIKDLVWFKCKVNCFRGAVTHLKAQECPEPDLVESGRAWWWIGAAGERRDDSAADFYKMLEAECARKAARGQPASEHLLPQPVDYLRLKAELAHQTVLGIRRVVRTLLHKSLVGGGIWSATVTGHEIRACVRAEGGRDGEGYVAISAEGFLDPKIIATILSAVPGITMDDWMVEPDPDAMNLQPRAGQLIYSAVIPPKTQSILLEEFQQDA